MTQKKTTTRKPRTRKSSTTKDPVKKRRTRKTSATKKPASKRKFDADSFYKKYPHVVAGSVKDVEVGKTVDGLKVVHSRICKIKCKDSGKTRTIHTQDAHQVFYTKEAQEIRYKARLAKRRQDKSTKKKKKAPVKKAA